MDNIYLLFNLVLSLLHPKGCHHMMAASGPFHYPLNHWISLLKFFDIFSTSKEIKLNVLIA